MTKINKNWNKMKQTIQEYMSPFTIIHKDEGGFIAYLTKRQAVEYSVLYKDIDEDVARYFEKSISENMYTNDDKKYYILFVSDHDMGINRATEDELTSLKNNIIAARMDNVDGSCSN